MINLQNGAQPVPVDAIEIDRAILDLQTRLTASLSWLTHGYGKVYRNIDQSRNLAIYFPEVFMGGFNYMRTTPDNDKAGQSIILVGSERVDSFEPGEQSFLSYDISILFTANLKLINSALLQTDYYQQNLIRDVRNALTNGLLGAPYRLEINDIEREFNEVWRDFDIEENRGISHSPLTHFRVNCTIYLHEDCINVPFDRCATILNMTTQAEQDCLSNALGGTCDWNDCGSLLANITEATKNTCVLPTFDFADTQVQSNVTGQQQADLINWLCVPACTGDFKVDDLAHAQQITFNPNDTICIADTAYTAVELFSVSGRIKGQFEIDVAGGNYYYIVDQGNSSLLRHNASTGTEGLAFFNTTNGNGYEAVGKPYLYNNKLYIQNSLGGANGVGTYCVYDLSTNIITKLFDLSTTLGYDEDNYDHARDIVEYNGKLFVTLSRGGVNGVGTIICYDTNTDTVTKIADLQASANILITNAYDAKAVGYGSILNDVLRIFYRDRFLTYDLINDVVLSDIDLGFATQNTNIQAALFTSNNRLYIGAGFIGVANSSFTFVYDIANSLSYTDTTFNNVGRFSMYENAGELFVLQTTAAFGKYDITEAGATLIAVSFNLGQPSGHTIDDLVKIGNNLYFSSATATFNGFLIQSYDLNTSTNTQIVSTLVTVGPTPDGVNLIDVGQAPIYLKIQ